MGINIATKISMRGWIALVLGILLVLAGFGVVPFFGYFLFIPISISFVTGVYLILKAMKII